MGFRFRKSINLGGGFRLNLSKSGIGYSWGKKGFRITKTASGKTRGTISLPGTGISYVTESSGNKKQSRPHNNFTPSRREKVLGVVLLIGIVLFLSRTSSKPENSDADSSQGQNTHTSEYSGAEILNLAEHPTLHSDFGETKNFYDQIGDDRVLVVTTTEYSRLQRGFEHFSDDNNLIYFIGDVNTNEYIGRIHINLFGEDLYTDMTIDKAVDLLFEYLPSDFLSYYKTDSTFQYSGNNTIIYICSFRLNEYGVEFCKNGHQEYSYYYCFKFFHRGDEKMWTIETGYEAYGGKSVGWIEKYADPWDINIG